MIQIPRFLNKIPWGVKEVCNMLEKHDCDWELIDINNILYEKFFETPDWENIEKFSLLYKPNTELLPNFKNIIKLIKDQCDRIKENDVVLISLFTIESRSWAKVMAILLRQWFKKTIRIGFGGNGLRHPGETLNECEWGNDLIERNLGDFILLGESSRIIKQQVENKWKVNGVLFDEGKNFPDLGFISKHIVGMDENRSVDKAYAYVNSLGELPGHGVTDLEMKSKTVKIHFTRGCVKKCTFCDVPNIDPIWQMRPAEKVIEEIDFYYNTCGATYFTFPDNTINGSNSEFMKYLRLLAKWKNKINNPNIGWSAQFSIKPAYTQTEEMFELLQQTNATLGIGFDHCSDSVLEHMKKLYTWKDCENFIVKAGKYDVPILSALWIIGYPTEEEKDFLEYNKLFDLLKSNDSSIRAHNVAVCAINRNSPLLDIVDIEWTDQLKWKSKINGLDSTTRIKRKQWIDNKLFELGEFYSKTQTVNTRTLQQ